MAFSSMSGATCDAVCSVSVHNTAFGDYNIVLGSYIYKVT